MVRVRASAIAQPTPRRCSTWTGAAALAQHTHHIEADLRRVHAVVADPAHGQRRSGPAGRGHRLQRVTEPEPRAGLDLADHERIPVAGHQVDLAQLTSASCGEHHHAVADQVPFGHPLAVASERVLGPHVTTSIATVEAAVITRKAAG